MQPGEYHRSDRAVLRVGAGAWHAVAVASHPAHDLHGQLQWLQCSTWAVVVGIGM